MACFHFFRRFTITFLGALGDAAVHGHFFCARQFAELLLPGVHNDSTKLQLVVFND